MNSGSQERRPRGRPSLPPGKGKRYALGIRTTRELKDLLQREADSAGRSLAQEIELRLERSFDRGYGAPRTSALLRHLAAIVEFEGGDDAWLLDREWFNAVWDRWDRHLASVQPPADTTKQSKQQADLKSLRVALTRPNLSEEGARRFQRYAAAAASIPEYDTDVRAEFQRLADEFGRRAGSEP